MGMSESGSASVCWMLKERCFQVSELFQTFTQPGAWSGHFNCAARRAKCLSVRRVLLPTSGVIVLPETGSRPLYRPAVGAYHCSGGLCGFSNTVQVRLPG